MSYSYPSTDLHYPAEFPAACCLFHVAQTPPASIDSFVLMQNQALQQIVEQNKLIASLISRINGVPALARSPPGESLDWTFRIVHEGELPAQILKERGFVLEGSIRDISGNLATEAAGMSLRISIFTQDNPKQPLTVNIAGKKTLRGTITSQVTSERRFCFSNVVINEVSSHYIDDVFTLIVSDEAAACQPLVIRRVSVRARKARTDKPTSP